jgi:hypothetical protein
MSANLSHRLGLRRAALACAVILSLIIAATAQVTLLDTRVTPARAKAAILSSLPIAFEPNDGQADPSARYLAHSGHYTLLFGPSAITLLLDTATGSSGARDSKAPHTARVGMEFLGASDNARIERGEALAGRVSYMLGNDPSGWRTGLPTYASLTYRDLYPGIDLKYDGPSGRLKGTFVVSPGVDPSTISWRYTGAGTPTLDDGNLVIPIAGAGSKLASSEPQASIEELAPVAWQEATGGKVFVPTQYTISGDGSIGFDVGTYDASKPLVIDPTLAYSTYLGGAGGDDGIGVAVDSAGNTYITGPTGSTNFPLMNPLQPYYGGNTDLFVTKINPSGTGLVWSTYLGGTALEISWGLAVDAEGSTYLAGWTTSDDFPTANAFQPQRAGGEDVIVAKINPAGTGLVYSTYLGGTANDEAWNIAQSGGFAYVTGKTSSLDFPVANAFQSANAGGRDIFVTKFSASGLSLVYSTYLGGSGDEDSLGVDIDANGNAYISGGSYSTDYPLLNAYQPANRGDEDIVVTALNPAGNALLYSTYLGGGEGELPWAVSVSPVGDAYVTGVTASADFPVRRALQPVKGAELDGFVTRLSPSGSWVVYSTFLGGNGGYDAPYGIALDDAGNTTVVSLVDSTDFPLANPIQATYAGDGDASVTTIGPLGTLLFSTYLGGSAEDFAWRVDVDAQGDIYTTGLTRSTDFPTANPIQPNNAGSPDAFALKITGVLGPTPTPVACTVEFTDVPPGSTFYPYIHCLVCEGLATGYDDDTFRPNDPTSRGQLAKIVSNAAGYSEAVTGQTFEDVPAGSSFHLFVERLYARGRVAGYPCGGEGEPCVPPGNRPYFRPGARVTRGQAAKIVAGTAAFPLPPPEERLFEDVPPEHSFFRWIETMAWLDLVEGYPCGGPGEPCVPPLNLAYFRPGNDVTRGQAAKLVASSFLPECIASQAP